MSVQSTSSEQPEQVASMLGAIEEKEPLSKTLDETEESNLSSNVTANNPANLLKMHKAQSYSSSNGPTTTAANLCPAASASVSTLQVQQSLNSALSNKPILTRQERATSSHLASPQLSILGTSEETSDDDNVKAVAYQLMPSGPTAKCRTCQRLSDRRSSISPSSVIHLPRSSSKESLCRLSPGSTTVLQPSSIPPVFITTTSLNSSRVIRQSSQPEATLSCCNSSCASHAQQQTSSLRQLTSRDASDPIAGIATETLRVIFTILISCFYY
jgi:hypothetical protein